ncbi:penicillin-insensitive murein endopeptidase [Thiocapsa imhoffii]|uniref:Penicillin-insensitive murein endopeptidase n=1 Tax=Thiocapsa imhoffii TaxID=382777 RepID=A0A9X1BA25_9GAMM|nr:penicillin-insensitive murein endopeptidase [Thiocapsa imhoffii]MBK1645636.1 penicillin-insensitive murein endopeptidase [Thiocapsa imhoffii]
MPKMSPSHCRSRHRSLLFAVIALLIPTGTVLATPWGNIATPSSGAPRVIGGVSNGCLGGAAELPETGPGYVSIRRYRNRYYGHPDLIEFVAALGRIQRLQGERLIMIGDLAQPRGGLMSSSHRSHQNGLDVDIWFTLVDSPEEARRLMDHRTDPPSMVQPGGRAVNTAWGPAQRELIESAARHPDVDRIFVHAAIKQALCQTKGADDAAWLRKIRPWWGHDAHFHVRLHCPTDSPDCVAQEPLPAGSGCGAELAWWFSEEALNPSKRGGAAPRPQPSMPAACTELLREG